MSATLNVLWPKVPRLAVDDPARCLKAANFAATHNRQNQPWRAMGRKREGKAWRVYQALCKHVNESGESRPSYDRIGELTGLAKPHISAGINRLIETGYVERLSAGRRGRAADYFLPDIRAALIRKQNAKDVRLSVPSMEAEGDWERNVQTIPVSRIGNLTDRESVTHLPRIGNPVSIPFRESHKEALTRYFSQAKGESETRTGKPDFYEQARQCPDPTATDVLIKAARWFSLKSSAAERGRLGMMAKATSPVRVLEGLAVTSIRCRSENWLDYLHKIVGPEEAIRERKRSEALERRTADYVAKMEARREPGPQHIGDILKTMDFSREKDVA